MTICEPTRRPAGTTPGTPTRRSGNSRSGGYHAAFTDPGLPPACGIRRAGMVRSHRGPSGLPSAASRARHIIAGWSVVGGKRRWMSSCLRTSPVPGAGTRQEGSPMRQIRITKRQHPARCRLEPLPLDLRDPDIVRAKQLARRASPSQGRPGRTRALPQASRGLPRAWAGHGGSGTRRPREQST